MSLTRAQLGQRESDRMLTPAPDFSNSFAMLGFPTRAATYNGLKPLLSCELTLDPDLSKCATSSCQFDATQYKGVSWSVR